MEKGLFLLLLGFFCSVNAQDVINFTDLKGDYLGQNPPGDTPVVFASGIVSDNFQQHGTPSFSSDGNVVFWQTNQAPKTKNDNWISNSMTMRCIGDVWTKPEISPYGSMPFFSPNGKRIYFSDNEKGLCYVEKKGKSWSEPKSLDIVARYPELKYVHFPSIARNGAIYFMGYAAGQCKILESTDLNSKKESMRNRNCCHQA